MSEQLLETKGVSKRFGGLKAVDRVDCHVLPGEILGILGPNGAGKTVFFNLITGIYQPTEGEIFFHGSRIDGRAPHLVAQSGIGRTFQIVKPFRSLTVLDNVLVALGVAESPSLLPPGSGPSICSRYEKSGRISFKIQPDMVGASAYDAFMMICDGIKRAKSVKGDDVRNAIANIKNFNGLTGEVKKFVNGEVVKDVQVQIAKKGRFRNLGVVTDPDLITP